MNLKKNVSLFKRIVLQSDLDVVDIVDGSDIQNHLGMFVKTLVNNGMSTTNLNLVSRISEPSTALVDR